MPLTAGQESCPSLDDFQLELAPHPVAVGSPFCNELAPRQLTNRKRCLGSSSTVDHSHVLGRDAAMLKSWPLFLLIALHEQD